MGADELDRVGKEVIDAALEVHRAPGRGLLEAAYEENLAWERTKRGTRFECQVAIPVRCKELRIEDGNDIDMLEAKERSLELNSVDSFQPVHTTPMPTYLKMTGRRPGVLLNFGVDAMRRAIKRVVNQL